MFKSILACSMVAFVVVFADQITIDSPAAGRSFSRNTTIEIKYTVNNGVAARMYSASAALVNDATNERVESFPPVEWSPGHQGAQDSWTIPDDFLTGDYSLVITGQTTRQGKQSTSTQMRTFHVTD